jgi:hypothetical protein
MLTRRGTPPRKPTSHHRTPEPAYGRNNTLSPRPLCQQRPPMRPETPGGFLSSDLDLEICKFLGGPPGLSASSLALALPPLSGSNGVAPTTLLQPALFIAESPPRVSRRHSMTPGAVWISRIESLSNVGRRKVQHVLRLEPAPRKRLRRVHLVSAKAQMRPSHTQPVITPMSHHGILQRIPVKHPGETVGSPGLSARARLPVAVYLRASPDPARSESRPDLGLKWQHANPGEESVMGISEPCGTLDPWHLGFFGWPGPS